MKKLALITALGLVLAGASSAFAYDNDHRDNDRRPSTGDRDDRGDRIEWRIDRLNRMVAHVRAQLGRYHGDWRLRREVDRIAADVHRIEWRARNRHEGEGLRGEIDNIRGRLHSIEERLHVRRDDWYRWD
jgi:hypothetical protein